MHKNRRGVRSPYEITARCARSDDKNLTAQAIAEITLNTGALSVCGRAPLAPKVSGGLDACAALRVICAGDSYFGWDDRSRAMPHRSERGRPSVHIDRRK